MSEVSASQPDPFRCYLGTRVRRERCDWVVVGHTVQDCALWFRLRQSDTGSETLVTLLDLLELDPLAG
jgi:hypothetical protein